MSEESKRISITLRYQDNTTEFKVKPTTRFKKIINSFAEKNGMDPQSLRILNQGERIQLENTVEQAEVEDDDTLDVMMDQIGGWERSWGHN
ncbi:ubiquitin-like protein [Meredithblackwellia eburnea MCA 4105]